ncbi:MAG TPA: FlgD immunoglobulin-like domain containing protein [bacterium]|nr:FlgD immunoglobulin-like domain containing protein [bacterium]
MSKDHGDHWSIIGLQDYFHLCSAVHPDGRIYVGGSNPNGLFTSHDEGRNWRIVHYQQPDFHRSPVVSDVAIGADYRIYLIADGHPSVSINESPYAFLLERAQFATSIFVSRDQSIYIGAFEGHVLYSADRGAHFTRVSIPGLTATISCFSEDRDGALYFGTEGNGIWRSDDRGNSWLKESLADSVINDLTADSSGRIYAAANSGLYRRMENSTWAQRRSRISDRTMPLVSAYPNPFNSSMAIEVQFDGGPATVKIVDAIGRPVATLYDQALAKGVHRFHWNGKDEDGRAMCSGVYFVAVQCTVQGSTFKPELHKIILLR